MQDLGGRGNERGAQCKDLQQARSCADMLQLHSHLGPVAGVTGAVSVTWICLSVAACRRLTRVCSPSGCASACLAMARKLPGRCRSRASLAASSRSPACAKSGVLVQVEEQPHSLNMQHAPMHTLQRATNGLVAEGAIRPRAPPQLVR